MRWGLVNWLMLIVLLASGAVLAGVKCPVCNQVFDDKVKFCPNDGTDLHLLGEEVSGENDSPDGDTDETHTPDESPASENKPKYKRPDWGGRQRTTEEGKTEGTRLDRERRLQDGRNSKGQKLAAERRRRARARRRFDQEDAQARANFAARRAEIVRSRILLDQQTRESSASRVRAKQRFLFEQGAPFVSMGARLSWMAEGADAGPVSGAEVDVNLMKETVRLGLSSFLGTRKLSSRSELIFGEQVTMGLQVPWRFSPFVVGRLGIGALLSHRFGANLTALIRSLGADVGVDCRLERGVVISPSVGFVRFVANDAGWNSITFKISVGF